MSRAHDWRSLLLPALLLSALSAPLPAAPASPDDSEEEEAAGPSLGGLDIKNPDKMRQEYEKRVAANPEVPLNQYNLGIAYQKLKRWKDAVGCFAKYTELKADDPKGFYYLGYNEIQAGQSAEAVPHLEKAMAIAEEAGDDAVEDAARSLLGDAYLKSGKFEKAVAMYEKLLASGEEVDRGSIYNNLGHIYTQKGEVDKGVEYFKKAAGADPNNATSQFNLGATLYNIAQKADPSRRTALYKASHEAFERAISLSPRDSESLYWSGWTAVLVNDSQEAKQRLQQYLEASPRGKYAEDAREVLSDLE